jgi:acyl carrier protein
MLEDDVISAMSDQLEVPVSKISLDSKFVDDLGADSLDIIELIMQVEEKYDIQIPDKDAEKLVYVRDVIDYIKANSKSYQA